jgi:hypothetical protein
LSVWFVIPSCRPPAEAEACLDAWWNMGYNVAIIRAYSDEPINRNTLLIEVDSYQGWARSVNMLVAGVIGHDSRAEWFVTGGDDYYPDPHRRAEDIAAECENYFAEKAREARGNLPWLGDEHHRQLGLFGVMQPTGDRWAEGKCTTCAGTGNVMGMPHTGALAIQLGDACPDCRGLGRSAVIDRICGSPWMGREFCRRMYHGGGPLYNGYYHNFADEELQNVARKLGVFWQRRDIVQEHKHWAREQPKTAEHTGLGGDVRNMPEWARKINDPKLSDWERSKALFQKRKASGFPGHEPLEV